GPYATGGIHWALSPRTHLELEAGERYRKPYYSGNIEWRTRRIFSFHARYTQGVDTPQSVLAANLLGIFVDPRAPLPPLTPNVIGNPNDSPFGLVTTTFRRKAAEVGLDASFGRNTVSVLGAYERRVAEALKSDDHRASATLARQIATNMR